MLSITRYPYTSCGVPSRPANKQTALVCTRILSLRRLGGDTSPSSPSHPPPPYVALARESGTIYACVYLLNTSSPCNRTTCETYSRSTPRAVRYRMTGVHVRALLPRNVENNFYPVFQGADKSSAPIQLSHAYTRPEPKKIKMPILCNMWVHTTCIKPIRNSSPFGFNRSTMFEFIGPNWVILCLIWYSWFVTLIIKLNCDSKPYLTGHQVVSESKSVFNRERSARARILLLLSILSSSS